MQLHEQVVADALVGGGRQKMADIRMEIAMVAAAIEEVCRDRYQYGVGKLPKAKGDVAGGLHAIAKAINRIADLMGPSRVG